eukprot:CAMPEP_0206284340 /NCGR_PEP_ID=MMETSP0047_2-20121206/40720_1 /ASSEMBLY_ACC=CAM_ASM_000192 /TAXON_ID=195065 /ORGANISM="Chroomonas mesostigmatica_cf, Strain CCMP1168" /LENGTH=143 /DNA_ID=CAMNT_0053714783 /DNA_START=151 /DNA_END=580 /DNA_ORIENTATION=+
MRMGRRCPPVIRHMDTLMSQPKSQSSNQVRGTTSSGTKAQVNPFFCPTCDSIRTCLAFLPSGAALCIFVTIESAAETLSHLGIVRMSPAAMHSLLSHSDPPLAQPECGEHNQRVPQQPSRTHQTDVRITRPILPLARCPMDLE